MIEALWVLVTACFLRGRGFARCITSSSETSVVTDLRLVAILVSAWRLGRRAFDPPRFRKVLSVARKEEKEIVTLCKRSGVCKDR